MVETAGGVRMKMSPIQSCAMSNCAYNRNNECTTMAINVGAHAECNTYIHGSARGGFPDARGGIGACLAAECRYNKQLECAAPCIAVADHYRHADCCTFEEDNLIVRS